MHQVQVRRKAQGGRSTTLTHSKVVKRIGSRKGKHNAGGGGTAGITSASR